MAARGLCRLSKLVQTAERSRHIRTISSFSLSASYGEPRPSTQCKRFYHCINVQGSNRPSTVLTVNTESGQGSRRKSIKVDSESEDSDDAEEGSFERYGISQSVQEKLRAKGITYLFPVQYETHQHTLEGLDVVVQARTGTGKTLSFGIPLVEMLQQNPSNQRGRYPKVIILEPTRELANQVAQDLRSISDSVASTCLYGGSSYEPQEDAIRRGLDVVIGTPGRVSDMIRKGVLRLDDIKHVVLDEVDKMLDMGFSDQVENIIRDCYNSDVKPQTLMYSATMPHWVFKIARKYLKSDYKHLNLIGDEVKTSTTVEHLALKCHLSQRSVLLNDIIQVYSGQHGRAMVFCQTKRECDRLALDELAKLRPQVLHGDIPQAKRDSIMKAFKKGHAKILITTDVASRGLDIPNVDLVIQTSPPQDEDYYIHRSGRTGRAGKSGVSVLMFTANEANDVQDIQKRAKLQFKMISAPTPAQIINASAHDVSKSLDKVLPETLEHFREPAQDLIDERGAETALAAAMAVIAGSTKITARSLLSHKEGYTTYTFRCLDELRNRNMVYQRLKLNLDEDVVSDIKDMKLLADKKGAVFDVPSDLEETLKSIWPESEVNTLEKATELPEIEMSFEPRFNERDNRYGQRWNKYNGSMNTRRNSRDTDSQWSGSFRDTDSRWEGGFRGNPTNKWKSQRWNRDASSFDDDDSESYLNRGQRSQRYPKSDYRVDSDDEGLYSGRDRRSSKWTWD